MLFRSYKLGCYLDGWAERVDYKLWKRAFDECGVSVGDYTREFSEDEVMPWDFMDIFVTKDYLLKERHKAYKEEVTGSCFSGCKGCGMQKEYKCKLC